MGAVRFPFPAQMFAPRLDFLHHCTMHVTGAARLRLAGTVSQLAQ